MAQTIFGDGVTVLNATYTGDPDSSAVYSNGDAVAPGVTPGDSGVIFSTGDLSYFTHNYWQSNVWTNVTSNSDGPDGVPDFDAQAGANTYDAAYLDVDFVPTGDVMTMQFVFASEEFPEYATGVYQDYIGVWINGQFVDLAVGDGDIDPNNLTGSSNPNLYLDNTSDQVNTEMDGLTITMTLTIPVNAGQVNSIRIGIADVLDNKYDSTLLIAADSVQTTVVAVEDSATMAATGSKTIDVLANDVNQTSGTLTITHINNVAVSAGGSVVLNSGQTVQLNADGTLTIIGNGDEEEINFTYAVESSTGGTDVGFVTVDAVPCFVAGTRIATTKGDVAIEDLNVGDMILTRDAGPQPLRWVGMRTVAAQDDFAPIRIEANTFGAHGVLMLSPLHRVLVRDSLAELMFGTGEVLVAARDLVNGDTVRVEAGGEVSYLHLLFDEHQVIFSEGLETESFLPGPQTQSCLEADMVREICTLFPEIDISTGEGYGPAARRTLKPYEARLLVGNQQAA